MLYNSELFVYLNICLINVSINKIITFNKKVLLKTIMSGGILKVNINQEDR